MQNKHSLKNKAITSFIWSFIDLFAKQGFQLIIQIILARLLLPEYFGVIGMILIFIALSNSIVDSGFSQALIRDKNTTQEDYSTVFFFNLFIATIIYIVLYFASPLISTFFNEPQLIKIIRVVSVVLILNALGLIQSVMLIKRVDFKTQTKISVTAVMISGIITVILAFLGFGVWSLVFNILSMQLIQTVLLWIYNRWIPVLRFNIKSFKKHFNFGYKLLLSGLIDTFYNNIYYLIIGKFYSAAQLGFYTNAVKIRDQASQSIAATVQRVSYPILSTLQDDDERLKNGFKKTIKMSAFINFPLMIGLVAIANPLFLILLGEKWLPSVVYFQFLCLAGMLYPLHAINLNVLQVKGKSDLFLKLEIIKKVLLTVLIGISMMLELGIMGLIGAAVLNSYISLFINTYFSAKEIAYSAVEQMKDLLPILIYSIGMGVTVSLVGAILPFNKLIVLGFQIAFGIMIYMIICKLANLEEFETIYKLVNGSITKFRVALLLILRKI